MDDDTVAEQMQKRFTKAPQDVQNALSSPDAAAKVIDIAERYQIGDQIHTLVSEVSLLMTGITHPQGFVTRLMDGLELTEEKARTLASELNQAIFHDVRESLKKVHHIGKYAGLVDEDNDAPQMAMDKGTAVSNVKVAPAWRASVPAAPTVAPSGDTPKLSAANGKQQIANSNQATLLAPAEPTQKVTADPVVPSAPPAHASEALKQHLSGFFSLAPIGTTGEEKSSATAPTPTQKPLQPTLPAAQTPLSPPAPPKQPPTAPAQGVGVGGIVPGPAGGPPTGAIKRMVDPYREPTQ